MIPLREQEAIRQRFEEELTGRVRIDYFTQRPSRIIIPGRQDCVHCEDVRAMLDEIAHLSPRISLTVRELVDDRKAAADLGVDKVPGIAIRGQNNRTVRFSGIPMGTQFPVFVETIIEAARGTTSLKPETARQLKKLNEDIDLQVYVLPSCPYAPAASRSALRFALLSPRIRAEVIELTEFPSSVQRLDVRASPSTLINEKLLLPGALDEAGLLQAIFKVVEGKPLDAGDFKPGAATMLEIQQQQSQPRQTTSSGGIILPR